MNKTVRDPFATSTAEAEAKQAEFGQRGIRIPRSSQGGFRDAGRKDRIQAIVC